MTPTGRPPRPGGGSRRDPAGRPGGRSPAGGGAGSPRPAGDPRPGRRTPRRNERDGADPGRRPSPGDAPRHGGRRSSTAAGSARRPSDRDRRPSRGRATAGPGADRADARGGRGAGGDGQDVGEPVRLNKALSGAGLGSRRAVEELVRAGRVSIGGKVVHDLGRRVDPVATGWRWTGRGWCSTSGAGTGC